MTEAAPVLAVFYEPDSMAPLLLAEIARGRFGLVWIVDGDTEPSSVQLRLLARLGGLVDVCGLDPVSAADRIRAAGATGLVAFADAQLLRAAEIAAILGVVSNPVEVAHRLTNKYAQRVALAAAGLPVPGVVGAPAHLPTDKIVQSVAALSYPLVLKPQAGGGSRDTYFVTDRFELAESLRLARSHQPELDMIVEEYLGEGGGPGDDRVAPYVSVEQVVSGAVISTVAVTGRTPLALPFRETGSFVPSTLAGVQLDQVLATAAAAARALGVTSGCLHTEVKLTPVGPRIIEVNGRIGGGGVPQLVESTTGFSLHRAACEIALGEHVHVSGPLPTEQVAYFLVVQPPQQAHRLVSLDGVEGLRALAGVSAVSVNRQIGDEIDWTDGSYGYLLSLTGVAPDHASMLAVSDDLSRIVHPQYT
jgi:biotin carboxylase